ncbi:MAG: DUF883 family protein [Phycisphaera sp.]|nr:DUF883 family protein [Phycisphaera sp.]
MNRSERSTATGIGIGLEDALERNLEKTLEQTQSLQRELDKLKSDFQRLRSDAAAFGTDSVHAARVGLNEGVRAAAARSREAADAAGKRIASHPFLSVGAGFAIGVLLGMRLSRRP